MRLEQFERLKAAGLRVRHDGYTEEFFVYDSDEVESKESDSDETDSEDSSPSKYPKGVYNRGKYHPDSCSKGDVGSGPDSAAFKQVVVHMEYGIMGGWSGSKISCGRVRIQPLCSYSLTCSMVQPLSEALRSPSLLPSSLA
jgi:hypothetical protein